MAGAEIALFEEEINEAKSEFEHGILNLQGAKLEACHSVPLHRPSCTSAHSDSRVPLLSPVSAGCAPRQVCSRVLGPEGFHRAQLLKADPRAAAQAKPAVGEGYGNTHRLDALDPPCPKGNRTGRRSEGFGRYAQEAEKEVGRLQVPDQRAEGVFARGCRCTQPRPCCVLQGSRAPTDVRTDIVLARKLMCDSVRGDRSATPLERSQLATRRPRCVHCSGVPLHVCESEIARTTRASEPTGPQSVERRLADA